MDKKDVKFCKEISKEIIENVEKSLKNHFGNSESGKFVKIGADGTPTKYIDLVAEDVVIESLQNAEFVSYLISEEVGELKLGKGLKKHVNVQEELSNKSDDQVKFIFLVDPLDGTTNAIKKIPAYGISIAIAEIPEDSIATLENVKIGFVKNFYNGDLYEAVKGEGARLNGTMIKPSTETRLSKLTLGGFFKSTSDNIFNLIKKVRRMRILGSVAIELSYVANGKYDVFIDMRGSRIIDIAASKLIVEESGGIASDQYGKKLKNKLAISEKGVIVGSGNKKLHKNIINSLNGNFDNEIATVGIVSRLDNDKAILFAAKLIQILLKRNIEVKIESSLSKRIKELKNDSNLKDTIESIQKNDPKIAIDLEDIDFKVNYDEMEEDIRDFQTDIIITLGGDGTILRAQNHIGKDEIPIFGINMGTVGFLTEVEVDNAFKTLKNILKGKYYTEKRTQLIVSHENQFFTALNEVVIMTEKPAKMLDFEIRVDGEVVEKFRADGLILATPSGSTAYSMSAGGPIVDPKVKAFIIIPICPFKLGFRAFVVPDESEIRVKLTKKGKNAVLVVDGQIEEKINYHEEIKFEKSKNDVYFIKTNKNEFYQKVKEKLTEF